MTVSTKKQASEAIRFEHVHKSLSGKNGMKKALYDVTAVAPEGQIVTIVGPSGAGKSTLLSLCNLLESADEGTIRVFGKVIEDWDVGELRRKVGLVFQTPTALPGTVLDNLLAPVLLHGGALHHPASHLQRVGLTSDLLERSAEDLSGGQKQRVAIARTLVNKPQILLLDEITSALDVAAARDVENLLVRLQRESNLTLLWVTHNLEQARRVGTDTWLLVEGALVEQNPTKQFFTDPREDLTRQFLAGTLSGGATQ